MLIIFDVKDFRHLFSGMLAIQNDLKGKTDDYIKEDIKNGLLSHLAHIEEICATLNVDISGCAERLKNKINKPQKFIASIDSLWAELRNRIFDELQRHSFMYIPETHKEYYKQEMLLGLDVYGSFPDARDELTEAGNCYATGVYTACVFHLMRAVEIALKKMVVDIGAVKYLTKPDKKNPAQPIQIPVDLCDWDMLIKGLRSALKEFENGKSKNVEIKANHAFYSEAINTFTEFKDAWRNTISHGHEVAGDEKRKLYKIGETEDIIKSTRHFMTLLATKVKDKTKQVIADSSNVW